MDIPGADLLMNSAVTSSADVKLPELESVSLDFTDLPPEQPPAPKLVPTADEVGVTKSRDGLENFNAEAYLKPTVSYSKVSDEAIVKKKYELLRKFDRLNKLGVPMRKRFTMDSPLEEMELELEFIRREKAMDSTIKQFSEWFISGMSAMEWSSKNVNLIKMFGLQLDGLSQSAQMNVGDFEEDFEELYELYGDKMRMHPLVRIPMRTCLMVYMVHLTNQMAMKAPVPNIQEILRTNPDIARQMAASAMQQQTAQFKNVSPPAPPAPALALPWAPSSATSGSPLSVPVPTRALASNGSLAINSDARRLAPVTATAPALPERLRLPALPCLPPLLPPAVAVVAVPSPMSTSSSAGRRGRSSSASCARAKARCRCPRRSSSDSLAAASLARAAAVWSATALRSRFAFLRAASAAARASLAFFASSSAFAASCSDVVRREQEDGESR